MTRLRSYVKFLLLSLRILCSLLLYQDAAYAARRAHIDAQKAPAAGGGEAAEEVDLVKVAAEAATASKARSAAGGGEL